MPTEFHTFYRTPPLPCPYLPGRLERKLFTVLDGAAARPLHEQLSQGGFRRSHGIVYRPMCEDCAACRAVRVHASGFRPGRSMRRVLARNASIEAREVAPVASAEQYRLFRAYQCERHPGGGMADMDFGEYRAMVEETPVETFLVEFRGVDGTLFGVSLGDRLRTHERHDSSNMLVELDVAGIRFEPLMMSPLAFTRWILWVHPS